MKGLAKFLLIVFLFFISPAFGYVYENIELYNEGEDPCCVCNSFAGFYFGAAGGYSWYYFKLHRPPEPDLLPLRRTDWQLHNWVPIAAVGYDFFPRHKIPARFEINFTYDQDRFNSIPLFLPEFDPNTFVNDKFRLYNTMATAYIDLHTCTRFVPFLGISAGYVILKTLHHPNSDLTPTRLIGESSQHSLSYGGTVGTRFFFTNHFVGSLQFRFNDLNHIQFRDHDDLAAILPGEHDYGSEYLHEMTLMLGLVYEL